MKAQRGNLLSARGVKFLIALPLLLAAFALLLQVKYDLCFHGHPPGWDWLIAELGYKARLAREMPSSASW
jgi:hypothetical protein